MTNQNEERESVSSSPPALGHRVSYLEQGQRDIWQSLRDFEEKVERKIDGLFEGLSKKLDQNKKEIEHRTTTNWQPISIFVTAAGILLTVFVGAAGTLLTLFVNSQIAQSRDVQVKHDAELKEIRSSMVPRTEYDRAWSVELDRDRDIHALLRKQAEEQAQRAIDLAYMRGQMNPLSAKPAE